MNHLPAIPLAHRSPKIGDLVLIWSLLPNDQRQQMMGDYYPMDPCVGTVRWFFPTSQVVLVSWTQKTNDADIFSMRKLHHGNVFVRKEMILWNYGPISFDLQHPLRQQFPNAPNTQEIALPNSNSGYLPMHIELHIDSRARKTPLYPYYPVVPAL